MVAGKKKRPDCSGLFCANCRFSELPGTIALVELLVALLGPLLLVAGLLLLRALLLLTLLILALRVLAMVMIAVLAIPAVTLAGRGLAGLLPTRAERNRRFRGGRQGLRFTIHGDRNSRRRSVRDVLADWLWLALIRVAVLATAVLDLLDIATAIPVLTKTRAFHHDGIPTLELPIGVAGRWRVRVPRTCVSVLVKVVGDRGVDAHNV